MGDVSAQPHDFNLADFLAWEALQDSRHEYADGTVVGFAGGTLVHSAIAAEILAVLRNQLRDTPCRAFGSDLLVATPAGARYPDVSATCDERDLKDPSARVIHHPKLIVEVLSASTAAVDRGEKLDEYRAIESLEEYVLIDSRRRWVEIFRRVNDTWVVSLPVSEGPISLSSVDVILSLDELYDGAGVTR